MSRKAIRSTAWAEDRSIPVPESGCWLWLGAEKGNGYGNVREGRSNTTAHRRSYQEAYGPVPKGIDVCHKCDTRLCINPEHLFFGSRMENMQDCVAKGRSARGLRLPQTKLTESQIQEISATDGNGETGHAVGLRYGVSRQYANAIRRGCHTRAAKKQKENFSGPRN